MADVRCQMCGKLNPPELNECKFCGARLKPVISSAPIDSGPTESGEEPIRKNSSENKEEPVAEDLFRSVANEGWIESSADENSSGIAVDHLSPDSADVLPGGPSASSEIVADNKETPDWLAGLRGGESVQSSPESDSNMEESSAELGSEDWIARLGENKTEKPEPSVDSEPVSEAAPESDSGVQESPSVPQEGGNLPEWLYALPSTPGESEAEKTIPVEDLSDQQKTDIKASEPESVPPAASVESVSDWLSNLDTESETREELPGDESPVESGSSGELSDWRTLMGSDVNVPETVDEHKKELDIPPIPTTNIGESESLPEWLGGLVSSSPPVTGTPALIEDGGSLPVGTGETSPFTTVPDWLSGLSSKQGEEKGIETEKGEGQAVPGGLVAAELPAWVQAMRPVESVVAEAMTSSRDDDRVTELTGPLAGLRGVLPSGPGIGPLRKPPAYSDDLQVSAGQQRYAASLEQLIAGEATPRGIEIVRPASSWLLRWLIALLIILAVGIPLLRGAQIVPGASLSLSDKGAASELIDGLPKNVPVLVAFDYDPALFGELEATAAPFIDGLLGKGIPLAFISTSPTGPALAERFMQMMPLAEFGQSHSGVQYVNLGYLAGGPAGMLLFAGNPVVAAPSTVDGNPAWGTVILQDIHGLGDFSAFIVLTDNSDTARNWIEQAGPHLGNLPMIMIISTQAEPMIRPYFDSGQLKGLVSGLGDAEISEQSDGRSGLVHLYWSSFSVGLLVIAVLIVIGAVWNAMSGKPNRRDNPGDEV